MSITTYTELKAAIADLFLRTDLTSVIPTFISLAEAQFQREIRDYRMMKRATAEIDSGYSAIPADWLQNIRFQLNTSPITTLEYVTPDQAAEELAWHSSSRRPLFFTMVGEEFQVVPAPDGTYEGELTYYSKIPALSASVASNWLLDDAPDIYLYGASVHTARYLKDDEAEASMQRLYRQALEALSVQSDRASIGSSSIRMRPRAMA